MYLEERLARSPVYLCTAAVYFLITDPEKNIPLVQYFVQTISNICREIKYYDISSIINASMY